MKQPEKVQITEVSRWLEHPVTRLLIHNLTCSRDDSIYSCGTGGAVVDQVSIAERYQRYQGAIDVLSNLLETDDSPLKGYLIKNVPDLIIFDEETPDGES